MQYRSFFTILFLLIAQFFFAQDRIRLVISDKYQAELWDEHSADSIWTAIRVVERVSGRELLKTEVETIPHDDMHDVYVENFSFDGKIDPFMAAIIYYDFNFDSIPDLAIRRNYEGAYHVYLANEHGGFDYSSPFSDLTDRYRALFRVDTQNRQLVATSNMMGGYWDWFYLFAVENDIPRLVQKVKKSTLPDPFFYELKIRFVDQSVEQTQDIFIFDADYLNETNTDFFYSFPFKDKTQLLLFVYDRQLCMAKIGEDNFVEWCLPRLLPENTDSVEPDSVCRSLVHLTNQQQEVADFVLTYVDNSCCLSVKSIYGDFHFCNSVKGVTLRTSKQGKKRLYKTKTQGKASLSDLETMKISNLKFD